MNFVKKLLVVVIAMPSTICAWASPWAIPVKVAAEKVSAHAGGRVAGETAIRGGAALAAATARHEAAKAAARATTVKIVEKATPGKILATGAGAALVVGSHEAADGVQAMCTSVGKAVEDNPEAAVGLGREVLSLPKTVIGILAAFAMTVLTWVLWPFFMFVRNWIRLVTTRKARTLATVPVENGIVFAGQKIGAAGFVHGGLIWALAGFLLLTVLGVWGFVRSGSSRNATGRFAAQDNDMRTRVAHRAKVIAELRKHYEAEVDRIHKEFLAEVDSMANVKFGQVRANIPGIVAEFGTMSRCAALVKAIALDKLRGGTRAEKNIRRDLEASYYDGLYSARDNVAKCLQGLETNLENAHNAFIAQLQGELSTVELPNDDEYRALLEDCGERIEKGKYDLATGQFAAGVAVAVEAACARQTLATASRMLGSAAARQAGTMTAGVGAAVADGPLPFGDIICGIAVLGCAAWTGVEVYQATKVLPEKLAETLRSATNDCERKCREDVRKMGEVLISRLS